MTKTTEEIVEYLEKRIDACDRIADQYMSESKLRLWSSFRSTIHTLNGVLEFVKNGGT